MRPERREVRREGSMGGFSLLEVVVATSILVVLSGLVMGAVNSAGAVGRMTAYRTALRTQARIAIERIARLVRDSGASAHVRALPGKGNLSDTAWGIQFERATGWNATEKQITWSPPYRIEWVSAPGEVDGDGIDNDGNGLIDDGLIQVTEVDAAGSARTYTLAAGCPALAQGEGQDVGLVANGEDDNGNMLVDESGLSFELSGRILTIRISLARRGPDPVDPAHPGGEIVEESVVTGVLLQNP